MAMPLVRFCLAAVEDVEGSCETLAENGTRRRGDTFLRTHRLPRGTHARRKKDLQTTSTEQVRTEGKPAVKRGKFSPLAANFDLVLFAQRKPPKNPRFLFFSLRSLAKRQNPLGEEDSEEGGEEGEASCQIRTCEQGSVLGPDLLEKSLARSAVEQHAHTRHPHSHPFAFRVYLHAMHPQQFWREKRGLSPVKTFPRRPLRKGDAWLFSCV